jgi:hypothetical protein
MFRALICLSSGGTISTPIGIRFCAYYVGWLLAGLSWIVHLVGPIIPILLDLLSLVITYIYVCYLFYILVAGNGINALK